MRASRDGRRSAAARRADVLDAAIAEVADRDGAARTTVIAQRAAISEPYLFKLFGTKRHLLLAAYARAVDGVRGALAASVENVSEPEARLAAMFGAWSTAVSAAERQLALRVLVSADPALRELAEELIGDVRSLSRAGPELVERFCGRAAFGHLMIALHAPAVSRRPPGAH
jgi:AcrR family transcriptional regulator